MKKIFNNIGKKVQEIRELRKNYEENQQKQKMVINKPLIEENNANQVEVTIKTFTVVKVVFVVGLMLLLFSFFSEVKDTLILATISFFVAAGLSPAVDSMERYKIPRPLAILILYILFFGGLGLLVSQLIPIIVDQLKEISRTLSSQTIDLGWFNNILQKLNINQEDIENAVQDVFPSVVENLQSMLGSLTGSTFSFLTGLFEGLFNLFFALVLIFFILMEKESIFQFILLLFPEDRRSYLQEKSNVVQMKMGKWFRGQAILMFSMGTFMYIGMKILEHFLGMEYAATIGLLAAFMELFPYIGVIITGLLCVLIAINISWILVLVCLGWIALAQFLEGNILVPIVMEKAVGLSAVVVMLALVIGGSLGSTIGGVPMAVVGMILAIPIAASISIFVEEYAYRQKSEE